MAPILLLSALLLASDTPAAPAGQAAQRDAQNFDVLLSQYPARARAAGEQGPVVFQVTLDRDGYATACEVTQSSGYPRLDNETCQLILDHATFRHLGEDKRKPLASYTGVVNWKLSAAAANPPPAMATASAAAPEKMICHRTLKTGSLADFERTCATKADWDRLAARHREEWGEIQGAKGSSHGQ